MQFSESELSIIGSDLGRPLVDDVFEHLGSVDELCALLSAKTVLVTGGGGSIGGAMVLALLSDPRRTAPVVVVDIAERPVAALTSWAASNGLGELFVPFVGDVADPEQLDLLFSTVAPDVVIHAAAVKHVPTCETNRPLAQRVNVEATRLVLAHSARAGVERFVLASTDKATSRANVLGETKYQAELEVAAAAAAASRSEFAACSVRLPNVWGSSGSVVELWRRALATGYAPTLYGPTSTRYYQSVRDTIRVLLTAATAPLPANGCTLVVSDAVRLSLSEVFRRVAGPGVAMRLAEPRAGEVVDELLLSAVECYAETEWAGILQLLR